MFNGFKMKHVLMLSVVLLVAVLSPGCYCNAQIEESEVGLVMPDGVKVAEVVGPGRFSNFSFYSDIHDIDVSAKTLSWEDPDLVTADKQPIGLVLGVTYARMRDTESVMELWRQYRAEALSDEALAQQVHNRIARVAKAVTAQYTLNEMLGVEGSEATGRQVVTNDLFDLLEPELAEVKIQLLDVGINNISPSPDFLDLLERKANAQVAVEVAVQETKRLEEQYNQEVAQTEIALEQARRQNLVNEELAQVYEQSPEYYALERMRLLADVVGDNDKIYFVPDGADLTLFLAGETGSGVPVPVVAQTATVTETGLAK